MEREPHVADRGTPTEAAEQITQLPPATSDAEPPTFHRIGGATIENLRLKPRDAALDPPGISVIKAPTPKAAGDEVRTGLTRAKNLHEQAKTIGSATIAAIKNAGFNVIPKPSIALPNHHRLVHPDGAAGFSDENLARLAEAFVNTTGHYP